MDAPVAEVQALRLLAGNSPICGLGIVKRFTKGAKSSYGFILVDGSEDIIFHASRGLVPIYTGGDTPGLIPWNPKIAPDPREGDAILYTGIVTGKGLRAQNWMLWKPEAWSLLADQIATRPLYRMIERKGPRISSKKFKVDGHGKRTLWEGKNVLAAPKNRAYDTDDGAVYFEELQGDVWVQCDYDPRYRTLELEPVVAEA